MKIVAGLQVFEEIDFIDSCIHSCCNSFDRVVVVEGSWSNTRKIAGDRSRDGTIEKIEELQLIYDNKSRIEKIFMDKKSKKYVISSDYNPKEIKLDPHIKLLAKWNIN